MFPNRFSRRFSALMLAILTLAATGALAAPRPFPTDRDALEFETLFAESSERIVAGMIEIQIAETRQAPGLTERASRSGHAGLDRALVSRGLSRLEGIFFDQLPDRQRFDDFRDRFYVAHVDPATDIEAACLELMALPEVLTAWPVLRQEVRRDPVSTVSPDDVSFPTQYYLATSGGTGTLRAKGAWGHSLSDSSIVVAVCDTGVDLDHPDLAGNGPSYLDGNLYTDWLEYNGPNFFDDDGNGYMDDWRGWDFVNVGSGPYPGEDYSGTDNDPDDFEGHGTLCAGCVSAICDNGIGIASIGWNTRILPLRIGWAVEDGEGGMTAITYSTLQASAFNYARIKGAQVINLSYGSGYTPSLASAVNSCQSAGVVIAVSAGNDNVSTADYLASTNKCVDVAATNIVDGKADFSNYGSWVDVSAPGVGIFTTAIGGYATVQGTSFSSPIAAGLIGQIYWSEHAGVTSSSNATNVVNVLTSTCDDIDAINPSYAGMLGSGRINAFQALGGGSFFAYPDGFDDFQEAIDFALEGDTIAVKSSVSTTTGIINPTKDLSILGAWSEDYESRSPISLPSTLLGTGFQPLVVFNIPAITPACVFDGFRLENGGGAPGYFPDLGTYGGAMSVSAGQPTLRNLVFADSDLSDEDLSGGGGLFVAGVDLTLENCTFDNNKAVHGGGLGVYDADVELINCDFTANAATHPLSANRRGGAIHLREANLTADDLLLAANTADDEGGGIYLPAGRSLDVTDMEALFNSSTLTGGAIHAEGVATITDASFSDNDATAGGASVYNRGDLTVTASAFTGNGDAAAPSFGGSLYSDAGSQIAVRSCSFQGEEVAIQGAALYATGASGEFVNNTVDGIVNTFLGCAVAMVSSDIDIRNNHFTDCAGGPPVFAGGAPLPTASYNNFHGNAAGGDYHGFASTTGDTHADPLYADAAAGDLRLLLDSPALDAGDPAVVDPDGGRSDIGAYGGPEAPALRPDSPGNLVVVSAGPRAWYVDLDWDDNTEGDLLGYAVYRSETAAFQPDATNRVALIEPAASEYRDEVADGTTTFHYKVCAYDATDYASGYSNEVSGIGEVDTPAGELPPARFAMHEAFPNPFNPKTTLRFDLPRPASVTLRVIDVSGRLVLQERLGTLPAGSHDWSWNGRDGAGRVMAAGIYHLSLEAGDWRDRSKLTLLK